MDNPNLAIFDQAILNREITWWQMELPTGNVIFGDAKNEMLGYPKEQFKTYQDFTKLVHPDDYDKIMLAMNNHLHAKAPIYEAIYRIKASNGEYITFYDYGKIIQKYDDKITVMGFVMKIKSPQNIAEEIQSFKNLIAGGSVTVVDLFSKLQEDNK